MGPSAQHQDSDLFQRYKGRIACDFQMIGATDSEIWSALVEKMTSWVRKSGLAKSSRWFSWNEQASVQLQEWWASRMVLEFYLGETCPLPEEMSDGRFSFKDASGLKLMYQCLTQARFEDAWTIYICQLPAWNFYSHQLHFIKSPGDGLNEVMRLVNEWWQDSHLLEMAQVVGPNNFAQLKWLAEEGDDPDAFAEKFFEYLLSCLRQRCSTFTKFSAPPFAWAHVLSEVRDLQQESLNLMQLDWRRLIQVECSEAPGARKVAQDLGLTFGAPERLLVQVLESAAWNVSAAPRALELLQQLVGGFADSKIIEDVHQALRTATGQKANEQLRGSAVQTIVQGSDVLEKRNIPHPCAITQDKFLELWGSTVVDFKPRFDFKAGLHKLPREYSRILGQKTWATVSEEQLTKSAACWAWLRHYLDLRLADHGIRIQDRPDQFH